MKNQKLIINDLTLPVSIGVHDWEKNQLQKLLFSVELTVDSTQAMFSDNLEDALDYTTIVEIITKTAQLKHYQLVEHLCHTILENLFDFEQLKQATVSITKFHVAPNLKSIQFIGEKHRD
jgi:dihydroneopterin aldolase